MRKLTVNAQVSIDGVMQAPGGPTEDPTKGFAFGGWMVPFRSPEGSEELRRVYENPFDLLLGRKTYEIFAAFWPYQDDWIAKLFNNAKKYVVSRSGHVDTEWAGTVLLRDLGDVKRLKDEDGPALITHGSTEFVHTLFARDLVDALSVFTAPVVLGRGKKLFADLSTPRAFTLTSSQVAPTGVIVAHYARAGEVARADGAPGPTSARETARQSRMKREG